MESRTYWIWITETLGTVSPQLRHKSVRKKGDFLHIVKVDWIVHPLLAFQHLSRLLLPEHWHTVMAYGFFSQMARIMSIWWMLVFQIQLLCRCSHPICLISLPTESRLLFHYPTIRVDRWQCTHWDNSWRLFMFLAGHWTIGIRWLFLVLPLPPPVLVMAVLHLHCFQSSF